MMHCMQQAPTFYAIPPCVHKVYIYSRRAPGPARPRPCAYDNELPKKRGDTHVDELTGYYVWPSVLSGAHIRTCGVYD